MMRVKLLFILTGVLTVSCGEFLDLKPDKKMVIPSTLQDLQALLNNTGFLNQSEEAIGEMSADNYYISDVALNTFGESSRLIYTWDKAVPTAGSAWPSYYRVILYANQVLESVEALEGQAHEKAILKGKALFFRGNAYYQLAQLFTVAYDRNTAAEQLGLPLRLSPGISERSERATLQRTYEQILADFSASAELLPERVYEVTTQPNKAAALAGLARTYLLMGDYESALVAGEKSLDIYNTLIDYNDLELSLANPIQMLNNETIYFSRYGGATLLQNNTCNVDTTLYGLFDEQDLRKKALFEERADNTIRFKGNFAGDDSQGIFNGITTAEVILIKAECLIRLNRISEAEQTLNKLLMNRYGSGNFQPVIFDNGPEALSRIFEERRKELLFRGSRWSDLRRLNLDENFQQTIYRNVGSEVYSLPPNDNRYVFPIPEDVIAASGMQQNER